MLLVAQDISEWCDFYFIFEMERISINTFIQTNRWTLAGSHTQANGPAATA